MNEECEYYCECEDGTVECLIHYEILFCGKNCTYASNMPCSRKPKRQPKEVMK